MDAVLRELGNKECVMLLQKWLREAERGFINHVALAAVIAPNKLVTESAGTINSQHEIFLAIDQLKSKIAEGIAARIAPVDPSLPANHVCFNVAAGIVSYDFLPWLICAEMRRVREGAEGPLQVAFFKANYITTSPYHTQMLQHVVGPLVQAIGAKPTKTIGGRGDFPVIYKDVVEAARRGETVPQLRPSDFARKAVAELVKDIPPFITITLRESKHHPKRNSDLESWLKFAKWLEGKGEEIIFVRDTAKADEDLDDHSVFPLASRDLHIRLALYEKAKHNFFVSNGPATLNWHMPTPFTMFTELDTAHSNAYAPAWPEWWEDHTGVSAGGQFPWFNAQQQIVWKKDSFENLCEAWEKQNGN